MKLISLNTWGGRAGKEKLLDFFKKQREVDIFCLQEVWSAPYEELEGVAAGGIAITHASIMVYGMQEITTLLKEHSHYFRPHYLDNYGLLMLINKQFKVNHEGEVFVHKEKDYVPEGDIGLHARNLQYVTIETPKGKRTIINFHGLWNGEGKKDSEDRLLQSENIIRFLRTVQHPYLVCGDFNLLPDTQSLRKLQEFGLRSLIAEYGVTSTRTSLYTKEQKFADYILVNEGIEVKDFKILGDEVSDHAPLYVEFE